jgi:hypothetical protein
VEQTHESTQHFGVFEGQVPREPGTSGQVEGERLI